MNIPSNGVKGWQQRSLLPPEVVEVHLKVGVVGSSGHAQFQVEAHDPSSGELLAMMSWPHCDVSQLEEQLTYAVASVRRLLAEFAGPF